MMVRPVLAAALIACSVAAQAAPPPAPSYPFVGAWDCGVATFTFTDKTYNNGSETLRMTRVDRKGGEYRLTFPKNYRIVVADIKPKSMSWMSEASGDVFTCKRVK